MGIRGSTAPRCAGCRVHHDICFCHALRRFAVGPRIVLFMHALEQCKPSNSGHLVTRVIEGVQVISVGGPGDAPSYAPPPGRRALVLHPAGKLLAPSVADAPVDLLVADGSWSQARHMMRRIPALRDAEPVRVAPARASERRLRRIAREGELSTAEAVAHALVLLGEEAAGAHVLDAYALLVEHTLRRRQGPNKKSGGPGGPGVLPATP